VKIKNFPKDLTELIEKEYAELKNQVGGNKE
jgi:hypothetical protein